MDIFNMDIFNLDIPKNILQRTYDIYVGEAKELYNGLHAFVTNPDQIWEKILSIDPVFAGPALIVATLGIGFVIMVVLANVVPEPKVVLQDDVVRKKGAPPIPPPTEVVSLRIYPIKSCRGFEVGSTRLRKTGLTLDRNWMFISLDKRTFLTIRNEPRMTLIETALDDDKESAAQTLRISISGNAAAGSVSIPAFPSPQWLREHTTLSTVEIWGEQTDAYEYGPEVNRIFCDFFAKPVALVYKGPTARMVGVNGSKELYGSETPHHFADVMSLLVASEASIADLNRRLEEKTKNKKQQGETDQDATTFSELTIERFRPNIIVRGTEAWEEDTWKRVRITTALPAEQALYKLDLDVVARCARCQVPNVNPSTAAKHRDEPWSELMHFRRVDDGDVAKYKPCFGVLCLPRAEGRVQVGSALEVLETTDKHSYNTAKFADL